MNTNDFEQQHKEDIIYFTITIIYFTISYCSK